MEQISTGVRARKITADDSQTGSALIKVGFLTPGFSKESSWARLFERQEEEERSKNRKDMNATASQPKPLTHIRIVRSRERYTAATEACVRLRASRLRHRLFAVASL
jgi:hypothetical protein